MSACFGPGLLAGLGWALTDEERVELVLQTVRQTGLPLREAVGGRLLEATPGSSEARWLDEQAAAAVAPVLRQGGSMRGRHLETVFGGDSELLLPGLRGWIRVRLALPGRERELTARGLEEQAARLREHLEEGRAELPLVRPDRLADARESIAAWEHAQACIAACLEHRLALSASW